MKIALIGFSFSGKTTTGKILAQKLKLQFIDSDEHIERTYWDINSIFSKYGEEYFRALEEKIIIDIIQNKNNFVLSLGGGAVLSKNTVKLLKEHTTTVWLKTSLQSIIKRDSNMCDHPLLNGENREETIRKLYAQRQNLYSFADIEVDTDNKSQHQTAAEILKFINCD